MDYTTGTDTWKYQWDLIHDPENVVLSFLQDEEEAAMSISTTEWKNGFIVSNNLATFLSPAGLPFTISISESSNIDTVLITTTSGDSEEGTITSAPVGSLMGFEINGDLYSAVFADDDATQFLGYKNETFYADVNTKNLTIPYNVQAWDETENKFKSYECSIDVSDLKSNSEAALFNDPDYLAAGRFVDELTNAYALADCGYFYHQYKDHILLEDDYFGTIVLSDLCVLNELQSNPFYGIEVDQDWEAQGKYFKIVFYSGIGVVVLPMVAELAATATTEQALQKSGEFAIGAIIDGTIQVGLDYLTDESATLESSLSKVEIDQMIRSGAENMLGSVAASATVSCLGDALLTDGIELKEDITLESFTWDCIWGIISEVAADKVTDKIGDKLTQIKTSIKNKPERFEKMLEDMDVAEDKIDEILEKFGIAAESVSNSFDDLLKKLDNTDLEDAFTADFDTFDETVKELFYKNNELVESWKIVSDLPDGKIWVRQNVDILKKFDGLPADKKIKLKEFYSTFNPNGPYPTIRNGITYNKYGFPEFPDDAIAPISNKKYFSETLDGAIDGSKKDYENAAKWFVDNNPNAQLSNGGQGIVVNGEYYTMHHMQDGKTIMPVLQSVHNSSHTGGASIIRKGLQGVFTIP